MMGGSYKKHEWLCRKIKDYPELAGIHTRPIKKSLEQELHYKGHCVVTPDIYFELPAIDISLEVKSGYNYFLFSKGMWQLERARRWARRTDTRLNSYLLMSPNTDDMYVDMLRELHRYKLGDTFESPSKIIRL